jgi:hypothetical protein
MKDYHSAPLDSSSFRSESGGTAAANPWASQGLFLPCLNNSFISAILSLVANSEINHVGTGFASNERKIFYKKWSFVSEIEKGANIFEQRTKPGLV